MMDSGNSTSIQSSSGGEEELDSRPESISSLFPNSSSNRISRNKMLNPATHSSSSSTSPSSQYLRHVHPQISPVFDPLSSFVNASAPPAPYATISSLNTDMGWSRGSPSPPNCSTDLCSSHNLQAANISDAGGLHQLPPEQAGSTTRSSKKRSRASRRAPTTVLTTDPSNFRAMVQEFTGIPAPPLPFPFARGRLDPFTGSGIAAPLPFPFHPFAHKAYRRVPNLSSSSIEDAVCSRTAASNIPVAAKTSDACSNITDSAAYGLNFASKEQPDLLNMPNSMLVFQSLLQPFPKYPSMASSGPLDSELRMRIGEEFPLTNQFIGDVNNQKHGNGAPANHGPVPSYGIISSRNDIDQLDDTQCWNIHGNLQRTATSCKMNGTASSSTGLHHVELNGASTDPSFVSRGHEGMVEPWICSSD